MRTKSILFLLAVIYSGMFSQERWQQRAEYKIDVNLNVETNILDGRETIKYYNNSPDTIKEIYVHLYWNAFRPGSFMNIKSFAVNRDHGKRISGLPPDEQGQVLIKSVEADGTKVRTEEYDTILKILLDKPLPPKESLTLNIGFLSQVPKLVRRAGRDNIQGVRYSIAQWYPKICEYDFEGWHNDEYAGREFHGVWGDFDVKISLDANYIVGATGVIQNPDEVKCGYELGKADTVIFPPPGGSKTGSKTWHFKAENVHDFAWAADDKYIHGIGYWKDVIIHLLYLPTYQRQWESINYYAKNMLEFYSENYGLYPYKQFTVAQAGDGGMEYPNIIFNAGYSAGLVAHEGGHQWFYGLLGNNESREAWLDEGFVTYTTVKNLYDKFGYDTFSIPKGIGRILQPPADYNGDYRFYWQISKAGIEEPVLTHSDRFIDDMVYGFETYSKGGMIIQMLEYTIGDETFKRTMKAYFEKWKFKHPNTMDFQKIAEQESGMDLKWFFDQWLRTTKTCDYAISSLSGEWITKDNKKVYRTNCTLENLDEIVMPIDLVIKFKNGNTRKLIIPVGWKSKDEKGSITLPRWDWVRKEYSFVLDFPDEVESAEIDPSMRLKDLNRLNNYTGILPRFEPYFIRPIQLSPPLDAYWINYKPYLWYTVTDGMKPGITATGGYMGGELIPADFATRLGLWYCAKNNQVDFDLGYSSSISGFGKLLNFSSTFSKINGIRNISVELNKMAEPYHPSFTNEQKFSIIFEHTKLVEDDYPLHNLGWQRGNLNILGINYSLKSYFSGMFTLNISSEVSFNSITDYSKISLEFIKYYFLSLPLKFRFFGGYSSVLPPIQKQFNLSSASAYEQYKNGFFRNVLGLSRGFAKNTNLAFEGGGNLRGYTGRFDEYNGKNLVSINIESDYLYPLKLAGLNVPVISGLKAALFFDAGNIWNSEYKNAKSFLENSIFDLGVLFELAPFEGSRPAKTVFPILSDFILRFNIPFWISDPKPGKNNFDWNWNVTIGKAISF